MPLNKFIAHCGVGSRRDAVPLIKEGKITVNGNIVTEPGFKVTDKDAIVFNGKKLFVTKNMVYILLNKPKDYITTSRQTTIPYTAAEDEMIPVVKDLFHKLYKKGTPIRLLGVRLSELTNNAVQTNLFSDKEKKTDLYKAIDDVKNRFGKSSVLRAAGKFK
jgi:ribosomal protein S4